MAAKRTSNAARSKQSKNTGAKGRAASAGRAARQSYATGLSNDIAGVLLAVIAVAMGFALASPTGAPVTHALAQGLSLGFGAGAVLVPVALFVFALTFFAPTGGFVSSRVALGLAIVVMAVLAMLSCLVPSAETVPNVVLSEPVAMHAGGFVGGGIAWLLLTLLGRPVTLVVLVGLILTGIVVCGFSVSDAVLHFKLRLEDGRERRAAQRELREMQAASDEEDVVRQPARRARQTQQEMPTSFLGARKTSVLRRPSETDKTRVLAHDDRQDESGPLQTEIEAQEESQISPGEQMPLDNGAVVPAFLSNRVASTASDTKAKSAPKTKRKTKKQPTSSQSLPQSAPASAPEDDSLPPATMLQVNPDSASSAATSEQLTTTAQKLQDTLEEFGLTSRVVGWVSGPSVTTFKIEMGEGERVNKITNLQDDIALSLAAKSVRIFAPIPGTSLVGIEIPNATTQPVYLGDVLPYVTGGPLEAAFGRDSEGNPVVVDIASLPHLLVAGTTGSGKSVLLNSVVMTMLMRATPEDLRLIMVDPKRVEFTFYAGLPHLYVPVVTEPRQAASALQWSVTEMERRLKVFEHYKVRDIRSFNHHLEDGKLADMENPPKHMPYFVIVIDELSDLMMVAGKDVEASIVRIAQLGRAAGIHLIVATQRPSADVVTGLIKANIDNRVALSVDNSLNSRIILDQTGAERLLGKGDMLYKLRGRRPQRAQACYVSEREVESVVAYIKERHEADYHEDILSAVTPGHPGSTHEAAEDDDPLLWEAAQIVVDSQLGSTSGLQRRLKVGYARAGRIMDMLEHKGIVGPPDGSKPREVLIDADGLEELRAADAAYREVD